VQTKLVKPGSDGHPISIKKKEPNRKTIKKQIKTDVKNKSFLFFIFHFA
jgi:hypothetical protein